MEIEEAFRHALDGDAILFLGAGFSLGAKNNNNNDFPLSSRLSALLMEELGEAEDVPLQIAAELFAKIRGEVGLLSFLNQTLGVRSVGDHHRSLTKPRWRRVYTTNYDSVFESAAQIEGRSVRTLVLNQSISNTPHDTTDCVHINGFLPWANAQNLHSTLILSETAYLTNRFSDSRWSNLFRSDAETARAVIFAGYSLADLDIARILVAIEALKRKCVFIAGPNPSRVLSTTLEKFGTISSITDTQGAAQVLDKLLLDHIPSPRRVEFSSFRQSPDTGISIAPTAQDVFNLYVKGELDSSLLVHSLTNPTTPYGVLRAETDSITDAFDHGAPVVVLLSRLANGKTVLTEFIRAKIRDRFDVFFFTKPTLSLADEVRTLRAPSKPTVVVIDDYTRHIDLIRNLMLGVTCH